MDMPLYRIDPSVEVTKYIGESEKNGERFSTRMKDSMLFIFFDEVDTLFGKRTEIKDGHGRKPCRKPDLFFGSSGKGVR